MGKQNRRCNIQCSKKRKFNYGTQCIFYRDDITLIDLVKIEIQMAFYSYSDYYFALMISKFEGSIAKLSMR